MATSVLVEDGTQVRGNYVGLDEHMRGIVGQMLEVGGPPRREVVEAHDAVPVAQQPVD